jgi:molecular chaperone Hsp33
VALLAALIGRTVKSCVGSYRCKVRGSGAARLIATDYYGPTDDGQPARIRAYASYDAERLDETADPFSEIGSGYFAIR